MKIFYENIPEDIIALQIYHSEHTQGILNQITKNRTIISLLIFAFFASVALWEGDQTYFWAGLIGAAAGYGLKSSKRSLHDIVKESFKEEEHTGVLCKHELEITGTELIERSELGSEISKLNKLSDIKETEDHIFIYTTPVKAHIIPRHRIQSGDLNLFLDKLQSKTG